MTKILRALRGVEVKLHGFFLSENGRFHASSPLLTGRGQLYQFYLKGDGINEEKNFKPQSSGSLSTELPRLLVEMSVIQLLFSFSFSCLYFLKHSSPDAKCDTRHVSYSI